MISFDPKLIEKLRSCYEDAHFSVEHLSKEELQHAWNLFKQNSLPSVIREIEQAANDCR